MIILLAYVLFYCLVIILYSLLLLLLCVAGVRCKQGEFPDEWLDWLNENLMRGVEAGKIVGILASKVFTELSIMLDNHIDLSTVLICNIYTST